ALKVLKVKDDNGNYINTEIANQLKEKYVEIMVDEYQDSNYLQEEILTAITDNNMFMVGDRKQSIYRFRMARPELFNGKYSYFGKKDKTTLIELDKNFRSSSNVLESINYIFDRIMHENIGGVEYDEAASLKAGAAYPEPVLNASEHSFLKAREDSFYYDNDLEFAIYESSDDDKEDDDDTNEAFSGNNDSQEDDSKLIDDEDYTSAELDARTIAFKIHNMMSEKHHYLVKDNSLELNDKSNYRPLEYRDIVILLRSPGNVVNSYVEILNNSGIPTATASTKGYFEAPEVRTVLSLLEILDNPAKDIQLTASLRHYFGNFTMEELGDIVYIYKMAIKHQMVELDSEVEEYIKADNIRLYDKLLFINDCSDEDLLELLDDRTKIQIIKEKIDIFLEMLNRYIKACRLKNVSELIAYIYDDSAYLDYCLALPNGEKRVANLNMLIDKARDFEANNHKGLSSFCRMIRNMKDYDVDFGEANVLSEKDNVVRIMSIHKSKGLEFPVVFVSQTQKKFNLMDFNDDIFLSMDYGLAPSIIDPDLRSKKKSIMKVVQRQAGKRDTLGEELRLLYVAMTRAKDKCIITAVTNDYEAVIENIASKPDYTRILGAKSYLDWLLMALGPHLDYGIEEQPDFGKDKSKYKDAIIVFNHLTQNDIIDEKAENTKTREEVLESLLHKLDDVKTEDLDELKSKIKVDYPYEDATKLRGKFSVSAIKHHHIEKLKPQESDEEENAITVEEDDVKKSTTTMKPAFLGGEGEVNKGALRGTAIHKFMELYDFNLGYDEAEYDRIARIMNDYDVPDMASIFSKDKLKAFFETSLAKEMIKASKTGKLYKEQQFMVGLKADEVYNDIDIKTTNLGDELVLVQGIVDAYYENDDETITIMDYKTDKVKTLEELRERYKTQLIYYGRIMKQITNKELKRLVLYSFKFDDEIEV
ncbi:MAG: UvrD-helicase domain-containing protein, partial [Lachnospiraceae bacterium]|nr:UvrD-helicase domain-containing protein [Lachnospiraceae bacterium]